MDNNKISHKIYDYLIATIKENSFTTNYKLPSENQLAEKFSASRMCAQLAYARLEKEKLIIKKKGSGCYINTEYVLQHSVKDLLETKIAVLGPSPLSKFIAEIYNTINDSFIENGLTPSFYFATNTLTENKTLEMLAAKRFDAIIYYPQFSKTPGKTLTELVNKQYPIVLIDRYYKGLNAYTVSSNHFASSYKIIEYFHNTGRKKILFISEPPIYTSIKHRFNGYKTALSHFPVLEAKSNYLLYDHATIGQFEQTLSQYLSDREFDAIITSSGELANKVLYGAAKNNVKIGEDISLALYDEEVSFDNIINFPYIKLIQNTAAIGETASKIIIDLLKHKPVTERDFKISTILKEVNNSFRQ